MLQKIKTLKEIIEPTAQFGIPFEEMLEAMDADKRFELFTKHFNQKNSSPFYAWSHISNLSCLIKTKEMVNFISEKFNVTVSEDLYSKWLKEYMQNWIESKEFIDSNYRNAEIGRPIVINVPGIGMGGEPEKRREREEEWSQKWIESSRNTQDVIKYFIEVLGINLKSSKYKVIIIDGIEELQKYRDTIKNEFGLNAWLEDYMLTRKKYNKIRYGDDSIVTSDEYILSNAKRENQAWLTNPNYWPSTGWRYAMNGKYRTVVSGKERSLVLPGHGDPDFNANIRVDANNFKWNLDSLEENIKFLKSNIKSIQEVNQRREEEQFKNNY